MPPSHGSCAVTARGLKALFVQVLALCARRGLVDLSAVAVDGSPMHAAAARSANRSLDALETVIADREAQLDQLAQDTDETATEGRRQLTAADGCLRRLSQLSDRVTRARVARDKLFERSLPSAVGIRIKVEAAQRMVAKAEARLERVSKGDQSHSLMAVMATVAW